MKRNQAIEKTKSAPERKILRHKWFLYMTEFFAGMSLMAAELGASRLLAPYFSSSQIVWTIIIGTIMIAMALGNLWGGRSADKNPDPNRLYFRLLIAAVWICLIPAVGKYIIAGITAVLALFVTGNFLIWAAFSSCMILFVFPVLLLGTVTPSLVKYTVGTLENSGKTVGALGALNTIGSILGTFLPTFVTIPAVGTSITFLIFGGILLVIALIYFFAEKAKRIHTAAAAVIVIACCIFGHQATFAFWQDDLLVEDESIYNYLQVREDSSAVYLSTNVMFGVQSVKMKEDGLTGMYYDYAMAAPFMAGLKESSTGAVLILGMGTGTYATQGLKYFENFTFSGVEIDEKIAALAEEYFDLPESVEVTVADGRSWLAASGRKYDVIMVDAYQDITIPFQMSSAEFFAIVKEHLNPGGVMVVNMNMDSDDPGSINEYLSDTIGSVFDEVVTVAVPNSTNRELFAGEKGMQENLASAIKSIRNLELRGMIRMVLEGLETYAAGDHILTDDKAPVELLGMKVIDKIIGDEVNNIQKIYKEKGLAGLLEMLD